MERQLVRALPYIFGGTFALGVLLFLISLYLLRLRRTGSYWRMRRRAGERGGRLFLLSVAMMIGSAFGGLVLALATLAYRNANPFLDRGPDNLYGIVLPPDALLTSTYDAMTLTAAAFTPVPPTATLTLASAPITTATAVPSATLPFTDTPSATDTPSPTDTPTPTSTFESVLDLTPSFNVTPRPVGASFRLTLDALAATPSTDGSIPATQIEFRAGIQRIYVYFSFENMENGAAWSRVLYRDGVAVQGNTLLWSLGETGSSSFFFGSEDGYDPGSYEVRLFVGDQEASRSAFAVNSG